MYVHRDPAAAAAAAASASWGQGRARAGPAQAGPAPASLRPPDDDGDNASRPPPVTESDRDADGHDGGGPGGGRHDPGAALATPPPTAHAPPGLARHGRSWPDEAGGMRPPSTPADDAGLVVCSARDTPRPCLERMPNEILLEVLGLLDVNDLLSTSRTSHLFRTLSLTPILQRYRLRRTRYLLPPLLWSPSRPSLDSLMTQSIFLTNTSVVSRRLARSLVCIRLSRRLAARPSPEALAERAVLPKECVPGMGPVLVSPAIAARRRDVERERVKDGLRRWIASTWRGEVREREEGLRRLDESRGVGRVWRLTRFWERVGRGEVTPAAAP